MSNSLIIALAQMGGRSEPKENLEIARDFAFEASQEHVDLLVFPEMFMALPRESSSLSAIAEPLHGHFVASLQGLAQEFGLHIAAGVWETVLDNERVSNTAVLISPEGTLLTTYRKLHLFDALHVQESKTMLAGNALPVVVKILNFHIGLAICYDLRFPELFRYLASQDADLLLLPSAWYAGTLKEDHWLTLLRARAIENTCYVAGCNQIGPAFCGRSAVFDPFGVPIADAGEGTILLCAKLNRDRIAEVRSKLPAIRHIRTDIFGKALSSESY